MAGRMQRQRHTVMVDALAVAQRLQRDVAQPRLEHVGRIGRGQVLRVADARVIRMRVRDHARGTGRQGSM